MSWTDEPSPPPLDLVAAAIVTDDPLAPAVIGAWRALAPGDEEAVPWIAELLGRTEAEVERTIHRCRIAGMLHELGEISPEAEWVVERALER